MRRPWIARAAAATMLAAACGPAHFSDPAPERVLAVDADGRILRQPAAYEKDATSYAARLDRVWTALQLSYTDLGIAPTISDRPSGRYGNEGFVAPRRLLDHPLGEYFSCGVGMSGPLIDQGRLYIYMVTTLSAASDTSTSAVTQLTASVQRNEGTSAGPVRCGSTGKLEQALRLHVDQWLLVAR